MGAEQFDKNLKIVTTNLDGKDVYDVTKGIFDIYGVHYDEEKGYFMRIPSSVSDGLDYGLQVLNTNTSGGRIRFSTNSKRITVCVKFKHMCMLSIMAISGMAGCTLLEDIGENKQRFVAAFMPNVKNADTVEYTGTADFTKMPSDWIVPNSKSDMRYFTLYLPLYNDYIEAIYVGLDKGSKVSGGKKYKNVLPILYYGSSISMGAGASRPDNLYQGFIEKWSNVDYFNLGISGNCLAQPSIVEYMKTINCSVFVCEFDDNAPNVEFLKARHYNLYKSFRETHKDTPIIFLTAVSCSYDRLDKAKRRKVIKETYKKALESGDKNVYYVDGRTAFPSNDYVSMFTEGTHPNDLGFYLIAKKLYKIIKKLV